MLGWRAWTGLIFWNIMNFLDSDVLNNFIRSFRSIIRADNPKNVLNFNANPKYLYFVIRKNIYGKFFISSVSICGYELLKGFTFILESFILEKVSL